MVPTIEEAVAGGHRVHLPEGTCTNPAPATVIPDVEIVEHAANGCDLTDSCGYPVVAQDGERSAWVICGEGGP
jgi:hypothetical protein